MMKTVIQQGSGSCDTDKVVHAEGSLSRGAPVENLFHANLCPGLHPSRGAPLVSKRLPSGQSGWEEIFLATLQTPKFYFNNRGD